ncbi:MAG: VWA domain-containing protein [Actinomycetia bacterium]|nr:VWA domain-containing protein [Actinomycetes bacterium]
MTQPPLTRHVVDFARALREHGLVAGPSEIIDAAAAAESLGFQDRERLRAGMAAALLRRSGERRVFDEIFDVYFPRAIGAGVGQESAPDLESADQRREHAAMLREKLAAALADNDAEALRALAEQALVDLGRLPNEASAGAFSAAQALDTLAPQTSLAAAMQAGSGTDGPLFTAAFRREELRSRVGEFREAVEAEARRRNAEVRGRQRISRYAVRPSADRQLFILAGPAELAELKATIAPLARKLATRLAAKRRRHQRGAIDLRSTLRRSMATGGVPMRPAYRHRPPHKPDLVVLADFSSSVAGFSRFTILLLQALQAQFSKVKVFGFVNVVADLTELFASAPAGSDLTEEVRDVREMTRWHRNSDYGSALVDFVEHHLDAVTARSTVLILGDARSNHTDPHVEALRTIRDRARSVIWLNPEPARSWGSGDSESAVYGQVVDMHECATIAHLRQVVSRILPV